MEKITEEESEIVSREQCIFAEYPVPKAVATMVIPTIISLQGEGSAGCGHCYSNL